LSGDVAPRAKVLQVIGQRSQHLGEVCGVHESLAFVAFLAQTPHNSGEGGIKAK
jgi:hypothetical protein